MPRKSRPSNVKPPRISNTTIDITKRQESISPQAENIIKKLDVQLFKTKGLINSKQSPLGENGKLQLRKTLSTMITPRQV